MRFRTIQLLFAGALLTAAGATAQTASSGPISFTAATDNMAAKDSIRIDLLRWSTDAERDGLMSAWNMTGAAAKKAARPAAAPVTAITAPAAPLTEEQQAACRKVDRGTTGSVRRQELPAFCPSPFGAPVSDNRKAAKATPEGSLIEAMKTAPFLGYLWISGEVAGYAIHYAASLPAQDGGERILLVTDRRLGEWNNAWRPAAADEGSDYGFSVVELHLNAKGEGEGKTSLTGKVVLDSTAKILALENYGASPVILKKVKREAN